MVETWNSANGFIFFGKGGEVASNRLDDQEASVHALHLLQSCLVHVNTLMPAWCMDQGCRRIDPSPPAVRPCGHSLGVPALACG